MFLFRKLGQWLDMLVGVFVERTDDRFSVERRLQYDRQQRAEQLKRQRTLAVDVGAYAVELAQDLGEAVVEVEDLRSQARDARRPGQRGQGQRGRTTEEEELARASQLAEELAEAEAHLAQLNAEKDVGPQGQGRGLRHHRGRDRPAARPGPPGLPPRPPGGHGRAARALPGDAREAGPDDPRGPGRHPRADRAEAAEAGGQAGGPARADRPAPLPRAGRARAAPGSRSRPRAAPTSASCSPRSATPPPRSTPPPPAARRPPSRVHGRAAAAEPPAIPGRRRGARSAAPAPASGQAVGGREDASAPCASSGAGCSSPC